MGSPILVVSGPAGVGKTTVARLVAGAFDRSVHLRMDTFMASVVNGWVDPAGPEAAHQNHHVGGAAAMAALSFAGGGYTVVLDGHVFPDGLETLAEECARRGVPLHYAVLRADQATCLARVAQRDPAEVDDPDPLARLHARYGELGRRETHALDASAPAEDVAAAVLTAMRSGGLAATPGP